MADRYISQALSCVIGAPLPTYQDSAGGLTPTPLRAWGVAQQLLLVASTPKQIEAKRAKVPQS